MLNTELGRLEARAERRALQNALLEFVRARFPAAPERVESQIRSVQDLRTLNRLIRRIATAETLEEIQSLLGQ
jgi:hypothetical protein